MPPTRSLATAAPAENWAALPDLVLLRIARHLRRVDVLGPLAMHLTCRHWHHSLGRIKKPPHWDASRIPLLAYRPRHLAWALECGWVSPGDALLAAVRRPGYTKAFFRAMRREFGGARTKEECNLAGLELRLAKTTECDRRLLVRHEYGRALMAQDAAVLAQTERRAAELNILVNCGDAIRRGRTAHRRRRIIFNSCGAHDPNTRANCNVSLHSEVCHLDACMGRIRAHPQEYLIVDAVILSVAVYRMQHHRCWMDYTHFGPLMQYAWALAKEALDTVLNLLTDHIKRPVWPDDPATALDDTLRLNKGAWVPLDAHIERILRETYVDYKIHYFLTVVDTFRVPIDRLRTWSNHLLRTAARHGLCGDVEFLVGEGLTADDVRTYDYSALIGACDMINTDVVRVLVGMGLTPKDLAARNYLAFSHAMEAALDYDDTELLEFLLTDERTKPSGIEWLAHLKDHLRDATKRDDVACLRVLVDHGGIPDDGRPRMLSDAVRTAMGHRSYDALRYLVKETGANVPRHLSNDVQYILHANRT